MVARLEDARLRRQRCSACASSTWRPAARWTSTAALGDITTTAGRPTAGGWPTRRAARTQLSPIWVYSLDEAKAQQLDLRQRRRLRAGLRSEGPLSLLPVEPRLQPDVQRVRVQLRLHRSDARLRRRARRGRARRCSCRRATRSRAADEALRQPAPPGRSQPSVPPPPPPDPKEPDATRPAAQKPESKPEAATPPAAEEKKPAAPSTGPDVHPPAAVTVRIDADGFERRVRAIPGPPADNRSLQVTERACLYLKGRRRAPASRVQHRRQEGEHGPDRHQRLRALRDGKKILFRTGSDYAIVDAKPGQKTAEGMLALDRLTDADRPARRVGAEVRRRLAHPARLVLRPGHARPGLEGDPRDATGSSCRSSRTAPTSTSSSASSPAS